MNAPRNVVTPPTDRRDAAFQRAVHDPRLSWVGDCPSAESDAELLAGAETTVRALEDFDRLPAAEEAAAFRLYNQLKRRFWELRRAADPDGGLDALRRVWSAAVAVRNALAETFLRLVIAAARRTGAAGGWTNDELVSELSETLLECLEHFDADRGFRFSTYITLAVRRQVLRLRQRQLRQQQRDGASTEEFDPEAPPAPDERRERQRLQVVSLLELQIAQLESREQAILRARLGLDSQAKPLSLRTLGAQLGISRERVRQLEQRALLRLRRWAGEQKVSLPV